MDQLTEIIDAQNEAAIFKSKAAAAEANAVQLIYQAVLDRGGRPGLDSLCLRCGAIVPPEAKHGCEPSETVSNT